MSEQKSNFKYYFGNYQKNISERLAVLEDEKYLSRLLQKDPSLWIPDASQDDVVPELKNRLGWLALPDTMQKHTGEIAKFALEAKKDFDEVVLLGMGGSSLGAQMFSFIFHGEETVPLTVIDTTNPETIMAIASSLDLEKTLFIVSSKSGGTIETLSLFKYFYSLVSSFTKDAGRNFVVITDPGSKLDKLANEMKFRAIFNADPDVGGRYSGLSHFGLVPAALTGIDIEKCLSPVSQFKESLKESRANQCDPLILASAMSEFAAQGRDKMIFLFSPELAVFGDWAEQLIGESLGKKGTGIVPVIDDYFKGTGTKDDTFFVCMRFEGDDEAEYQEIFEQIERSGQPYFNIVLKNKNDLFEEIYKWEIAVSIAGAAMKLNPFDQPDVESAKIKARELMELRENEKKLPSGSPVALKDFLPVALDNSMEIQTPNIKNVPDLKQAVKGFLNLTKEKDYISLLPYLPYDEEYDELLEVIRERISMNAGLPTTKGYGPRYLHSTGQLHKGGADNGLYVLITHRISDDLRVPGEAYSFGDLITAQAVGDYQALAEKGRRVIRLHISGDISEGLERIRKFID